jgi:hypothetical protein
MNVELIDSVTTFLDVTSDFRNADPLRTNVIGSVAESVISGRSHYDHCRWWTVFNDDAVVGIAMRTGPHNMVVCPMSLEAATQLGARIAILDDDLPGLSGPRDVVNAVLSSYRSSHSTGSSRAIAEERRDLLYELDSLTSPNCDGRGRTVIANEVRLVAAMYVAFVVEARLPPLTLDAACANVANAVSEGSLFCWEVNGDIVSIAAHSPLVETASTLLGRIGPVYSPPASRRHGYASAVTALIARHLVDRGARVMLFTDASNSTSNGIYQEIGFRLIDELVDVRFGDVAVA